MCKLLEYTIEGLSLSTIILIYFKRYVSKNATDSSTIRQTVPLQAEIRIKIKSKLAELSIFAQL